MKKRRCARRFLGGALVSLTRALSKHNRYFPSWGSPTTCPTMARNSPTVAVARCSWKALRNSSSTRFSFYLRFLRSFAHFLRQRLDNFCWSLRGAAAESNATNAVQDGGSIADPGPSESLYPSARRPSCSATPALEHMSLRVRLLSGCRGSALPRTDNGCYQVLLPGPLAHWDHVAEPPSDVQ